MQLTSPFIAFQGQRAQRPFSIAMPIRFSADDNAKKLQKFEELRRMILDDAELLKIKAVQLAEVEKQFNLANTQFGRTQNSYWDIVGTIKDIEQQDKEVEGRIKKLKKADPEYEEKLAAENYKRQVAQSKIHKLEPDANKRKKAYEKASEERLRLLKRREELWKEINTTIPARIAKVEREIKPLMKQLGLA